ncbi:MAG: hypothetical protein PHW69_04580, partial [Elusimicrobiaceae bacterium]|nr:hypothetical protein [Elusimicrobiaceae bacterium]
MKCPDCGYEHTSGGKQCRKCGRDLMLPPVWFPGWKWHVKTLAWIYLVLIALFFFVLNPYLHKLKPPYFLRDIPAEITPWLQNGRPKVTKTGAEET